MCFDLNGVTLIHSNVIKNFSAQQKEHEIYLNDEFTVSLFIPAPNCLFEHFSFNSKSEQEKPIEINI
jgi:hypothetical protein